ncbi:MAG: hypothetical protein HYU51_08640 [Candidatus Rokubacteria bacterium]|nr:hypothetical protein [Candidatus Rokubacteria bacterium]
MRHPTSWGAPKWPPIPPSARSRPGKPGTALDDAIRSRALALAIVVLSALALPTGIAHAQVALCTATGFATSPGAVACNGAAKPLTVTATVRTYAHLALDKVFGSPAASLQVAMGDVDAHCISTPAPGVTCARDARVGAATWYGDLRFRVKLAGLGATRAKLTGVRPTTDSLPSDRLVDGDRGSVPARAYAVSPASPTDLRGGLGNGETTVTRSLGLKVHGADPPGAWSGAAVYSIVIE